MANQFKWGLSKKLQEERRKAYAEIKIKREARRCLCGMLFKTIEEKEAHDRQMKHIKKISHAIDNRGIGEIEREDMYTNQ